MEDGHVKTVYGTVKNVKLTANTTSTIDFSKFIPQGYELVSANASFKDGKYWRSLPFCNDNGKSIVRILKVSSDKVYIRTSESFDVTTLQIVGFCKKS